MITFLLFKSSSDGRILWICSLINSIILKINHKQDIPDRVYSLRKTKNDLLELSQVNEINLKLMKTENVEKSKQHLIA